MSKTLLATIAKHNDHKWAHEIEKGLEKLLEEEVIEKISVHGGPAYRLKMVT